LNIICGERFVRINSIQSLKSQHAVDFTATKQNNWRITTMSRGVGGHSPANVQKFLKGQDYPADKKDLIGTARRNKAPQEVMNLIENLPEDEFGGPQDVMKGYGEEEQKRGGNANAGAAHASGAQKSKKDGGKDAKAEDEEEDAADDDE
jgi:hypothetical protein